MEQTKKRKFIIWSVVLVLILAVGGTAVFAQSQDDPEVTPPVDGGDTGSTTPVLPDPFARNGRSGFNGHAGNAPANDYLADALGITSEELQAAQEAANAAALEQAVADGLITQDQADQMSQFGGHMRGGHFGALGNMDEFLADELGISVEALQAAQEEAQDARLAQMVEDGVLTQEQADLMTAREAVENHLDVEGLNAAVQEAYATAVQAALDAGEITQEQADQLLSEAAAAPSFRFDFGGHGGPGGRGHGGHGFPGAAPGASPTTTTTADNNA